METATNMDKKNELVEAGELQAIYKRIPQMKKKEIYAIAERFDIYCPQGPVLNRLQRMLQQGLEKKFGHVLKSAEKPKNNNGSAGRKYNHRMYLALKKHGLGRIPNLLGDFHRKFSAMTLCESGIKRFIEEADPVLLIGVLVVAWGGEGPVPQDEGARDWAREHHKELLERLKADPKN